ncbi:chromatin assembly factor 1 subunit B [Trichonephila inaurata madagascariensis]|uniref:Chromatin assembly factor 1 subunit B n=1 Tax=Trichonephila inaurata madagascariensis TaxID=2747483 RepID=A0A8X6XU42_9ARAC|nr:chromatin assembly factor 1 subunit B [Trichonephila inaurata madagascariensis]
MKCQIPQISWHSRDPVLSIDFQPGKRNIQRLASGGTDSHVLIWYITHQDNKSIKIECASDLYRHNKSVNVVRFSPNGELLASGDDEGAMFVWQLKERDISETPKDEENANQEDWFPLKLLRGHLEDIYDISWSSDGNFLVSASMDNTAIIWDMQKFQKVHICSDSKGYVQGVTWDPLNSFIASIGSDRALRIFNLNTKKTAYRVQRAPWSVTTEKGTTRARLFFDDTLKSYFRRLNFTPDGELLIVPSGILERDEEKFQNTTYIFSRHAPNKPVIHLPTGDKYTVAVRCNPLLYKLRCSDKSNDIENQKESVDKNQHKDCNKENRPRSKPMIDLPYRMVFAVAACESILLYDTEQLLPFAYVSNIHYTHLTDLTWSPDGRILVAASTDGYCSFLIFGEDELGEIYEPPKEDIEVLSTQNSGEDPTSELAEKKIDAMENKPNIVKTEAGSVLEVNEEIAISPKVKSSLDTSKSSKKPKLCTIKKFFTSPKVKPLPNALKSGTLAVKKDLKQDHEVIEKSLDRPSVSNIKSPVIKKEIKNIEITAEPMEVDDNDSCSVEVILDGKVSEAESSKTKLKCETELVPREDLKKFKDVEFKDNTIEAKASIEVDMSCSNAVLSFDDSKVEIKEPGNIKGDEADWKLELSQDDEIPMVIADEPVASNYVSNPTTPKTPNQKAKRRISLITLSTKTSLKSPKH